MDGTEHAHHGYIAKKDDYLRRLRRIEGQARGLQRMVEEEKYCIDILTQVSAMTSALQSVALGLLDEHLESGIRVASGPGGDSHDVAQFAVGEVGLVPAKVEVNA